MHKTESINCKFLKETVQGKQEYATSTLDNVYFKKPSIQKLQIFAGSSNSPCIGEEEVRKTGRNPKFVTILKRQRIQYFYYMLILQGFYSTKTADDDCWIFGFTQLELFAEITSSRRCRSSSVCQPNKWKQNKWKQMKTNQPRLWLNYGWISASYDGMLERFNLKLKSTPPPRRFLALPNSLEASSLFLPTPLSV